VYSTSICIAPRAKRGLAVPTELDFNSIARRHAELARSGRAIGDPIGETAVNGTPYVAGPMDRLAITLRRTGSTTLSRRLRSSSQFNREPERELPYALKFKAIGFVRQVLENARLL